MLFNSIEFAFFFPIVTALYFLAPWRWRTPFLLAASCAFYMAFIPPYILILAITIGIDYTAGLYIERRRGHSKITLLIVSIIATCMVLFIFKYYSFFMSNLVGLATLFGWKVTNPSIHIILPIGLSFHTFQSLSYVIEVYHGRQKAERNFLTYATYVMFWPQLVAGPIERPQNLLHQFYEHHVFDYDRVTSGLKRMAWGFFKKLVVADRLAIYVNDVYASPNTYSPLHLTLATVFFAYQIYCDFSGYSDIAIGSARVLGFRLMENFRIPYHSSSIGEFWQRWHISLSTWFRDYVYIPLGGSRVGNSRWAFNVLVTFAVSGLWHGANWTYVVWGLLNGVYLVMGRATKDLRDCLLGPKVLRHAASLRLPLSIAATFSLTCIGWVFFRARSISDAWYILSHAGLRGSLEAFRTEHFLMRQMPFALASILALEAVQFLNARVRLATWVSRFHPVLRWGVYLAFVLGVMLCGVYRETQFIYFQF